MTQIIGLVATYPRVQALLTTSVPSIAKQSRLPDALVIVSDRECLSSDACQTLQFILPNTEVHFFENHRRKGVAGTWNTGLAFIHQTYPNAYVAILDDDDQWDTNHLALCESTAENEKWPDMVVSGLRICAEGRELMRPPMQTLSTDDFLIGNPGWQGSNTFALVSKLVAAGGFRESLTSCHDRDLAIRMLDLPGIRTSFTKKTTATWNLNSYSNTLSQPGLLKNKALQHFLKLHEHRMSSEIRKKFISRCSELYSLEENELQ